jgi:hypothetical protein
LIPHQVSRDLYVPHVRLDESASSRSLDRVTAESRDEGRESDREYEVVDERRFELETFEDSERSASGRRRRMESREEVEGDEEREAVDQEKPQGSSGPVNSSVSWRSASNCTEERTYERRK